MSMRFLVINTDYPDFLRWLYTQHPSLHKQTYQEQVRVRSESLYGVADFYSSNLRAIGLEAYDIYANNEPLQKAWAYEHGIVVNGSESVREGARSILHRVGRIAAKTPARYLKPYLHPVLRFLDREQDGFYDILMAQIKYYKPDVLLNQAIDGISSRFMREIKPSIRFLVGQHAATRLSDDEDFSCYDLMISSFPPTLDYFRSRGICAQLSRLGFEPRVLSYLNAHAAGFDVTFAGSFFNVHSSRVGLLETLCQRFPQFKIWAPTVEQLPPGSPIREHYMGQAWGSQVYQILQSSKMTLNHHGDVAPYANNMRLFEATGVGAFLITDWKDNLSDMFEPGKELVAYRSPEECVELIRYYLEHDEERAAIACAGQTRTLREHTYASRMKELVDIVHRYL